MKFFIIFTLLIAAVLADHHYEKKTLDDFKKVRQECYDEFHVTDEVKDQLKKFEYPDIEMVHNYLHCTSVKLGVFCDKMGYHKTDLMTQFGDDKGDIIDKCITKHDESMTAAKWAYSNWKCMVAEGLIKNAIKKD